MVANVSQVHIQSRPIRIDRFLEEASDGSAAANQCSKADRESLGHICWLYENIKIIILCTIVHYEQLVTVTASAIKRDV